MFENINEEQEKFIVSLLKKHVWQGEQQLENGSLGDVERGFLEQSVKKAKDILVEIGE